MDIGSRAGRFRGSFRSRLFLIFTFFTSLIFIVFVLIYVNAERRNFRERSSERAQLLASQLALSIRLPLYAQNFPELARQAGDLLNLPKVKRIIIRDSEKRTLVDLVSGTGKDETSLAEATASVLPATATPTAEAAISGVSSLADLPLGSVTLYIDTSDLKASILSAVIGSAIVASLFWVAVLLCSYPVLKRVTSSFELLIAGLNRIMDGDFSAKIVVGEDTEAGRAAMAVNSLSTALVEREEENRRLQQELLNSMRLEVQEEKRRMMAKLIQTNRMTSLGLLISSLAHNINTPNGAIKLAAQHLDRSWRDALPILEQATKEEGEFHVGGLPFGMARDEIIGASESILCNALKVEQVIRDLRAYNVGEKSRFTNGVSVNTVVSEALTIIRAHGRQGEVTILTEISPDLPSITGNKYQLEQVVVNLLMNAMQATAGRNGVVKVITGFSRSNGEVRISVSDQGVGIPPEVRKHLFEAFYSTRIESGGSGLGLYISKFIVSEHKGSIAIESEPGAGTVVTIRIPVNQDH